MTVDLSKYKYEEVDNTGTNTEEEKKEQSNNRPMKLKDLFSYEGPVKQAITQTAFSAIPGGQIIPRIFPNLPGDILTGLTRAGQSIPKAFFGEKTPTVNTEEVFGSDKGNKVIQDIAQYSPLAAISGSSLLSSMLAGSLYTALQFAGEAKPGESRIQEAKKGAATGAAMAALPFAIPPFMKHIVKPGYENIVKPALGIKGANPALKAEQVLLEESIKGKKTALEEAAIKHQEQLLSEQQAKTLSEQETGAAKPSTMQYKSYEQEKAIQEKEENVKQLTEKLKQHEELPELPKIDTESHANNVKNAEQALVKSNENIESLKQNQQQAKEYHNESENQVAEFVNSGAPHDEIIASKLRPILEGLEETIPANYSQFVQDVKNRNIQMPDNVIKIYNDSNKEIGELLKGKKSLQLSEQQLTNKSQNPTLDYILSHAPTSVDTNAGVFMDKLKDLRTLIYETKTRMSNESLASKRTEMAQAISKSKEVLESAEIALEKGLGKEDAARFKEVNKAYREVLYPLRENPTARMVMKHTRMPEDIAKSLRGSESGNKLLRDMIKNDPDALRSVVGQRYDTSTKKFYGKSPRLDEYTEQLPELKKLIDERNNSLKLSDQYKEKLSEANKHHEQIEKQHSTALKEKKSTETEAKRIETEKSKRLSEKEKIQSDIDKHKKSISDGNEKISTINKHIQELEKEANKTKATKEQVDDIKKQIREEKERLAETKRSVEKSKGYLIKSSKYLYRLGKTAAKKLANI